MARPRLAPRRGHELIIRGEPVGPAGLAALTSGVFPGLHKLDYRQPGASLDLARALADPVAFPALATLLVGGTAVRPSDPPPGDALERLRLRLDPATRRIGLVTLGELDYSLTPAEEGVRLGFLNAALDDVWPADAATLDWSGVSELRLRGVPVTPGWFASLVECFPAGLAALELTDCGLGDAHAAPLAHAVAALDPRRLVLGRNPLAAEALRAGG